MITNPFAPLPDNYDKLTPAEQKQARLAVLHKQDTPLDFVRAWTLFRSLYLKPMGDAFYRTGFVESPEFHYEMVSDLATYGRNAEAAPRGTAKSTVVSSEIVLLLALTRPFFSTIVGKSTDRLVEAQFDVYIEQLTTNPYILEDFGTQKPNRGTATWNHHHIRLNNGSVIEGISVMGRKRGMRPKLFILDDPECDPENDSQEGQQFLTDKFEPILFKQILPMLERGASIFWVGTLINRRSLLYHVTNVDDPKFEFWNRRVYRIGYRDPVNPAKIIPLWGARDSQEWLEALKASLGPSAWQSEYMNDPGSGSERMFSINYHKNEYTIVPETKDAEFESDPLKSKTEIIWWERDTAKIGNAIEKKRPMDEWLSDMFRILVFDYAKGLTSKHDYSCLAVLGFCKNNIEWVLDMWMGRAREAVLQEKIYEYGLKWQAKVLGIESSSMQVTFADVVDSYVKEKTESDEVVWKPRMFPIKYPINTSKGDRIASQDWRFAAGKIKLPEHLKQRWPFSMLYMQIADFTRDLALLPTDDAIDTVLGMPQYVIHAKGMRRKVGEEKVGDLADQIRAGGSVAGLPLLFGLPNEKITNKVLDAVEDVAYNNRVALRPRRFVVSRPKVKR